MKLVVEANEEGKWFYTGWVIHHAKSLQGGYCGWMLYSSSKKIRTSELVYHTNSCPCGRKAGELGTEELMNHQPDLFGRVKQTRLTKKDKAELNGAITKFILSSLRHYEVANEPFLSELIVKSMETGARVCNGGVLRINLNENNKLITGDGVRKNLDKVYEESVVY